MVSGAVAAVAGGCVSTYSDAVPPFLTSVAICQVPSFTGRLLSSGVVSPQNSPTSLPSCPMYNSGCDGPGDEVPLSGTCEALSSTSSVAPIVVLNHRLLDW